jgi:S-formylglutathione hydrolase
MSVLCRGLNVEGEADSWDFGVGAGFYINATVDKWKNWRMYDYIAKVRGSRC